MGIMKLCDLLDKASLALLAVLYVNFAATCTFTISCSTFIPTLSYLAAFQTHDLVTVLALTSFAFLLIPLFISFHLKTRGYLSIDELVFCGVIELAIFVLTILVGIIDEVNGIDFNPVDNFHMFVSFTLGIIVITWIYYAFGFLGRKNHVSKILLYASKVHYRVGILFFLLTLLQWHFAYTVYNNFFINPVVESICEWILITVALRFPYRFSRLLDVSVKIGNYKKEKN